MSLAVVAKAAAVTAFCCMSPINAVCYCMLPIATLCCHVFPMDAASLVPVSWLTLVGGCADGACGNAVDACYFSQIDPVAGGSFVDAGAVELSIDVLTDVVQ